MKRLFALALMTICIIGFAAHNQRGEAMEIQRIATPGGLEAWLVEEHRLPIIFVEMFWRAGASSEAEHLGGLVKMLSGLLDEGAGDLDSMAFQERLADLNIDLGFHASRDSFSLSMKTLTENVDAAFELLTLALTSPRFDKEAVERVRGQILAALKHESKEAEVLAARAWFATAFPEHAYGRPSRGTPESISAISSEDLRDWMQRALTRENIGISIVGDITADRVTRLLDASLAALPATPDIPIPAHTSPRGGGTRQVIPFPNPQSVIQFGHGGITRHDPLFIPAYVMNHILGGSVLVSRLGDEVREKRGLAYSVYSHLYALDHAGLFLGTLATENSRVGEALEQIRLQMARMRDEGVSEEELEAAKAYLTGSYPLRFDSGEKIAAQLSGIQRDELGIDYIEKRNALIQAVTLDDIRQAAQRILDPEQLLVVVVGEPQFSDSP